MQRARRLASIVSITLAGVIALGACGRSAPDVAAYVGDTSVPVDRVDEIYTDVQAKFGATARSRAARAGATPAPEQLKARVTQQDVVNLLVSLELGKRVAAAKQFPVPEAFSVDRIAAELQVPADTQYAQLWRQWFDVYGVLTEKLPPAELSDAALMAVYQAIVKVGAIPPGLSVAEVRETFGPGDFVRSASAVSAALREEATRVGTSINPRFRPLAVPSVVGTSGGNVYYALPYIDENGPVTDLARTATPAP